MSFKSFKSQFDSGVSKKYSDRIEAIKNSLIPTNEEEKKILEQNPDLNLTGDIEKQLIYEAKLQLALSDPKAYYADKIAKVELLASEVNAEFARVFKEVSTYASKKEAREEAEKSAANINRLGMHRIQTEYPDKLDADIERRFLIDLKNKV